MVRGVGWRALVVSLSALAVVAMVAGCGGSTDETKIAFLLPNDNAARQDRGEFEKKVKELCSECKVLYGNAQDSIARQESQAERALAEGADVLVVDPVDPASASPIARRARSAGVPVLSYARLIQNAWVDYYVGFDGETLGEMQAEYLLKKLRQDGSPTGPIVVLALGSKGPQSVAARSTIDAGGVRVAREYDFSESTPEAATFSLAKRAVRRAIDALGAKGFAAILASDDEAAAGAIAAMRAAGIDPRTRPTIGAGAGLSAVQRVIAGQQYISAYEANGPVGLAGAEMAVRLARGHKVPASSITTKLSNGLRDVPAALLAAVPVTWKNLHSTVLAYGSIKPAQLCAGHYVKYCAKARVRVPTG